MEIKYLREFVELAEKLNFTDAAESLYISQSGLSKHIRTLEKELDARLFERTSKQVVLTDFGKRYLQYAKRLTEEYERSEKWRREYARRTNNTVRIGLPESQELYEVADHFHRFSERYPEYRIETQEIPSYKLLRKLEQGSLNMALTGMTLETDPKKLSFDYIEVARGRIKVCISRQHPLADRGSISIRELEDERILLPPNDTVFQKIIEDVFFAELGYQKEFLYSSYSMAKLLAESGSCIALLQEEALRGPISDKLTVVEPEPAICYSRGIGFRKQALNEAERTYLKFACEQLGIHKYSI